MKTTVLFLAILLLAASSSAHGVGHGKRCKGANYSCISHK